MFIVASTLTAAPAATQAAPATADDAATASPSTASTAATSHAVRLQVETSAMGKEAESTRSWVLRDGGKALAEAGVEVAVEAEAEVRVTIEPKDLGYTTRIEVWDDGQSVPSFTRGPKTCETCTRTELVELVRRELAWVGGWLKGREAESRRDEEEPADGGEVGEAGEPEPEPKIDATDDGTERRKLHALGWSGVGVGALGLGTFIGGLAVVVRDYEARGEPGSYQTPSIQPRRAGWTMVGVGAAALVGGTAMLVIDLVKGRRTGVAAGPWLEQRAGGLWVRRRF